MRPDRRIYQAAFVFIQGAPRGRGKGGRRHPETVKKNEVRGRMSRRISPHNRASSPRDSSGIAVRTAYNSLSQNDAGGRTCLCPHPEAKPSGSHRPTSVHIYEGIRSPLAGLGMRPSHGESCMAPPWEELSPQVTEVGLSARQLSLKGAPRAGKDLKPFSPSSELFSQKKTNRAQKNAV